MEQPWRVDVVAEVPVRREKQLSVNMSPVLEQPVSKRGANPTLISLNIKHSKTDQGRTLLAYLARRGSKPGALFICVDGFLLMKTKFVNDMRSALTKAGLSAKNFTDYSFQIRRCCHHSLPWLDYRIQEYKHWADGEAWHISFISRQRPNT